MASSVDAAARILGPSTVYWTRTRMAALILAVSGCLVQCASFSVLVPFYPSVAKEKGNGATQIGVVFSAYAFVGSVNSPLIGKLLSTRITLKKAILFGLAIDGLFLNLMALLTVIESPIGFFVASFLVRCAEAFGFSLCYISYYTLVSVQFPDKSQIMVPLIETVFGFGIMIGPAVGATLFSIGGYRLPLLVLGVSSLVFAGLTLIFLSDDNHSGGTTDGAVRQIEPPNIGLTQLLRDHRILLDLIAITVCCITQGFNNSTIALWIEHFHAPVTISSLIFLSYGVAYALSSLVNGVISSRLEDCRILVLVGMVFFCSGISLMGPLPFLPIEGSPQLTMLGQVLMGIGNGAVFNLSYIHALKYVIKRLKHASTPTTYALVASLFSTGFFFGAFIGPILGGLLFDMIGYRWATVVVLLTFVIPTIPVAPSVIGDHIKKVLQSTPD